MTIPLQTALSGLLADATADPWAYNPGGYIRHWWTSGKRLAARGIATVHDTSDEGRANAALIVAAVRAVRWAHSEAGVEAIARLLWNARDERHGGPFDDAKGTLAREFNENVARAIVAAVAEAGVGG